MKGMSQRVHPPYYTNSTQLPVQFSDDLFETLSLQDELQAKYTGGTVMHIFLGEELNDHTTLKSLIRKVAQNYRIPYFTLTPTFSICPSHGYIKGEQPTCASCGQQTEVYSRVVGYLRPVRQWNDGKLAEYGNRKVFKVVTGKGAVEKTPTSPGAFKLYRTAVTPLERAGLTDHSSSSDGQMQALK